MFRFYKVFAVVLAFSLSVVAVSFSIGDVAEAASTEYASIGVSDSGNFTIDYLKQTATQLPDHSASINTAGDTWQNYFNFNLLFNLKTTKDLVGQYLTGAFWLKFDISKTFSPDGHNTNLIYNCPEYNNTGISFSLYQVDIDTCYLMILCDNYQIMDESIAGPSDWQIQTSSTCNSTQQFGNLTLLNVSGSNSASVSSSSGEVDLGSQIASGINASTDIDQIISLLSAISADTDLLAQVLSKLDNMSGVLANIYSELQHHSAQFDASYNVLWRLATAICGINITNAASFTDVQKALFENWVSIIKTAMMPTNDLIIATNRALNYILFMFSGFQTGNTKDQVRDGFGSTMIELIHVAINKDAPDTAGAGSELSGVKEQLKENESLEQQAFDFQNSAMSDVDFNIAFPTSVVSSAVVIMNMLAQIWGKLGNLQFLITTACLAGLLTIVLGIINRYSGDIGAPRSAPKHIARRAHLKSKK